MSLVRRAAGSAVVAGTLPQSRRLPFGPRERVEAARDRHVRELVAYAARHVPFYAGWLAAAGAEAGDVRGAADLERLPLLDRELVRAEPERFVARTRAGRKGIGFTTSGTTGTPLRVFHDRRSLLANVAHGEREREPVNRFCGGSFRPTELYVGYESSTFKTVTAFYEQATLMPRPRRRFVPLQTPLEQVAELVNRERPDVLVGYGGWIDLFFKTLAARGVELHPPRVAVYMGEALPHGGREHVEETFGVPLLSRYNAVESFKIGFSCEERTGFHVHEDLCLVRVVDDGGRPVPDGEPGQVVLGNLVNRATVLLNYPIGDVASLDRRPCPCGRTFVRLSELEGRVEDVIALPGGGFVHPRAVWEVLKPDSQILQYRLVQAEPRSFRLELATLDEQAFRDAAGRSVPGLRALLGADASIEARPAELRTEGKFRAVVSLRSGEASAAR